LSAFAPKVRLLGELGAPAARERAQRRLEAFLAAEAGRRLGPLRQLEAAIASGELKGLARGIAWRLAEAGGVIDRARVAADVAALSQTERRALKSLGVRFGAFSLFLPALVSDAALDFSRAFAAVDPDPRSDRALAARGLRAVGQHLIPAAHLERLDAILRELPAKDGGSVLPPHAAQTLGWTEAQLVEILRGLGFAPARKPAAGEPSVWRRRRQAPKAQPPTKTPHTPFAALAALTRTTERRSRKPRRRKPRVAGQ
jgi:ATP-dependent RNA helicase SUPV3L1/SUV3